MTRGIHWFRNDLRLKDNTALNRLADRADEWLPVFVLDPRLIGSTREPRPRTRFLLDCLERLSGELGQRGVPLLVRSGRPEKVIPRLLSETGATLLSFNDDVTPFARARDAAVCAAVERGGGRVLSALDHVIFGGSEIRTGAGGAYSVYTPYKNKWWDQWHEEPRYPARQARFPAPIPGFSTDPVPIPPNRSGVPDLPTGGEAAAARRLDRFLESAAPRYHEDRDRPDRDGTSRLSPYLRFGAISARQCVARAEQAARDDAGARKGISKWLDELVWREFYSAVLEESPRVLRENYRPEYDALDWEDGQEEFEAWCAGRTGFPLVDAGMRQLRATGWMHNRVRMIVASFLTKDLLIDWRRGERFFFDHLVDGDPASNNGGWQWAASTGTDAQPYFRIFNPIAQGQRWDPEGVYIRRWVPELRALNDGRVHEPWDPSPPDGYPRPIVDHAKRREIALDRFKRARSMGARR